MIVSESLTQTQVDGRPAGGVPGMAYALFAYSVGMAAVAGIAAFCFNIPVPRAVDVGPAGPIMAAVLVNLGLIALFGIQHSVMARDGFKRRLTAWVPEPLERATYVLATALVILPILFFWRPIPVEIFSVSNETLRAALWSLAGVGWLIVVITTFLIDHGELFGLRQAWCWMRGKAFVPPPFQIRSFYRVVRHPMQLGVLIGVWATPDLTVGRLLFAGALTAYVVIGLWFEERSLVARFGDRYRDYQAQVPFLIPRLK